MRHALIALLFGLFTAACGSDDGDSPGSPTSAALCMSQCANADECGFLEDAEITVAQCRSACQKAQVSINNSPCVFTSSEIKACMSAVADQECADVEDGLVPSACKKVCRVAK